MPVITLSLGNLVQQVYSMYTCCRMAIANNGNGWLVKYSTRHHSLNPAVFKAPSHYRKKCIYSKSWHRHCSWTRSLSNASAIFDIFYFFLHQPSKPVQELFPRLNYPNMLAICSWSTAEVSNEGQSSYVHMMSQRTQYIKITAKGECDYRFLHITVHTQTHTPYV